MNNENKGKSAIIIVGRAFKSTYYSGALKALDELEISQNFDLYVALSSGVPIMSYFLAGQSSVTPAIWKEYVPTKQLYNPKNILTKKPIVNLDYLVDYIFLQKIPLNIDNLQNKNLLIPLINYESGEIQYFKPDHKDFKEIIKASMSIPWITRKIYEVDGSQFVDAGIAENLIIKKLVEDGYSKILLMINRPKIHNLHNWKEILIEKLFLISNPGIKKMMKKIIIAGIQERLNLFDNKNYEIITISPKKYHISRFENSKEKITKNIEQGYKDIMEDGELKEKLLKLFKK